MHSISKLLFVLAVAACGQTASSGGSAEAANAGGGEAAWVEACVARYVAQSPQASQWAPDQCGQEWQYVVAAEPMADAILTAAGGGATPAADAMGAKIEVAVNGRTIEFSWSEVGAMIPYDAPSALSERGAAVTMIGCAKVGTGEYQKYYTVTPNGGSAFPLAIYERTAPTGDAWSFYNVSVEPGGAIKTIPQLRSDGTEWASTCVD